MIARLVGMSRADSRRARPRAARPLRPVRAPPGAPPRPTPAACGAGSTSRPGLVSDPQVIYLDEPTTGLDPRARNAVWDTVRGLVTDGATVLLTTQHLDEAEALADQIVVFDRGRVVAEGTSEELKAKIGGQTLAVRAVDRARTPEVAEVVARVTGARPESDDDTGLVTAPLDDPALLAAVVRRLDDAGIVAVRAQPAPAQPGRGLPQPHRPPRRRRRERGMTATALETDPAGGRGSAAAGPRERADAGLAQRHAAQALAREADGRHADARRLPPAVPVRLRRRGGRQHPRVPRAAACRAWSPRWRCSPRWAWARRCARTSARGCSTGSAACRSRAPHRSSARSSGTRSASASRW